ncbi:TetR family transcriptional regulator [Saccharothrix coeruleofusca]|uniref:TetR family transcriptional regulator n=1 Tax=Saccharothrix coeruleofusca TaxID=33919 RepID=A0A918AKG1_9PSEU|nr:TetR family transcriptional regulator [Saccharothrix coeruleofusca]MBP2338408.1 AcrR family transcriptional regulator [Saccharothrix coeruleofusca]GGP48513.1 TetR family transcriptional regulator [Saccharothrix coeruleofusca]
MAEGALTPEVILDTAEEVLRRFGPAKATVVDVARALGVSHGSVYRHFPTKVALREAVTRRWLDRGRAELAELAAGDAPASRRLRDWLNALFEAKRRKAAEDPELFATFSVLVDKRSGVAAAHVSQLEEELTRIISDGVASGEFAPRDPRTTARAVFDATSRFHNPSHAADWVSPDIRAAFDAVVSLVVSGLRSSE